MIPGITSTRQELWKSKPCAENKFRQYFWGSGYMQQTQLFNPQCWWEHMHLDSETWLDPDDIKLRAVQGLVGADYFIQGYWIWARLIEDLAAIGYDSNNLDLQSYDWRLSFPALEIRDGYFTRMKNNIIQMYNCNNNTKVVLLAHSMGTLIVHYFFQWVQSPLGGNETSLWIDKHIHSVINIGAPFLGLPKAISVLLSGETKSTADMYSWQVYLRQKAVLSNPVMAQFFRTFHSIPSMLPKGGTRIWGNEFTGAPDDYITLKNIPSYHCQFLRRFGIEQYNTNCILDTIDKDIYKTCNLNEQPLQVGLLINYDKNKLLSTDDTTNSIKLNKGESKWSIFQDNTAKSFDYIKSIWHMVAITSTSAPTPTVTTKSLSKNKNIIYKLKKIIQKNFCTNINITLIQYQQKNYICNSNTKYNDTNITENSQHILWQRFQNYLLSYNLPINTTTPNVLIPSITLSIKQHKEIISNEQKELLNSNILSSSLLNKLFNSNNTKEINLQNNITLGENILNKSILLDVDKIFILLNNIIPEYSKRYNAVYNNNNNTHINWNEKILDNLFQTKHINIPKLITEDIPPEIEELQKQDIKLNNTQVNILNDTITKEKERIKIFLKVQRDWSNPQISPLPNAPSMKIYNIYGVGRPTERGYVYKINPNIEEHDTVPFIIDTSISDNSSYINRGIHHTDGDGTVPQLSLGFMCAKNGGWDTPRYNNLNPGNITCITREYIDYSSEFDTIIRLSTNSANHVDIIGNNDVISDVLKVVGRFDSAQLQQQNNNMYNELAKKLKDKYYDINTTTNNNILQLHQLYKKFYKELKKKFFYTPNIHEAIDTDTNSFTLLPIKHSSIDEIASRISLYP